MEVDDIHQAEISNICPGEQPCVGELDPQAHPFTAPGRDQTGILDSAQFDHSDDISGFPVDPESSADWEFSFPASESDQWDGRPGQKKAETGPKNTVQHSHRSETERLCAYVQFPAFFLL